MIGVEETISPSAGCSTRSARPGEFDRPRPHDRDGQNISDGERALTTLIGGALAGLGLTQAIRNRSAMCALLAIAGGALVYRGVTGHSRAYDWLNVRRREDEDDELMLGFGRRYGGRRRAGQVIDIRKAVTINASPADLYARWRKLDDLPRYMSHLESVHVIDDRRSRWRAKAPAGRMVEWEAEITEDRPGERIAWRSIEGSTIDNEGSVEFAQAPGDRGAVLRVALRYDPPAGPMGALIARLFGEEPSQQIEEDLRRFKQEIEAGEITTNASPSARSDHIEACDTRRGAAGAIEPRERRMPPDRVYEASDESFPASDAPAWTPTHA